MPHAIDKCPWCASVISRSRLLEIEAMTRKQEQTKLGGTQPRIWTEFGAQYDADVTRQWRLAEREAESLLQTKLRTITHQPE